MRSRSPIRKQGGPAPPLLDAMARVDLAGEPFAISLVRPPAVLPLALGTALVFGAAATPLAKAEGGPPLAAFSPGLQAGDVREFFAPPELGGGILVLRRKDAGWQAAFAKNLVPMVLTAEAVDAGWLPPVGQSGLPASLEKVVPPGFAYWHAPTPQEALALRAALVEGGFFQPDLLKVVDGQICRVVVRYHLYEPAALAGQALAGVPPGAPPGAPVPATKRLGPCALVGALLAKAAEGRPIVQVLAADPGLVSAAPDTLLFASPPHPEALARVVKMLAEAPPAGGFFVEYDADPGAYALLTKLAPVLEVPHPEGARWVAASVPLLAASAVGAQWLDLPFVVQKDDPAQKTVTVQGVDVHVDRPVGFVQEGKDDQGNEWKRTYQNDYGYIKGTAGGDGESLDVFLGPALDTPAVYFVEQKKADGTFDEFKLMVGFPDRAAAEACYKAHIPAQYRGPVTETTMAHVKALLGVEPVVETAKAFLALTNRRLTIKRWNGQKNDDAPGDERYVLGVVLEPETVDKQQDIYSHDEVRNTAHQYLVESRTIGLMHRGEINEKVQVLESYLAPVDFDIGGEPVKKGSWLLGVRVLDDALWAAVKRGDLTGFSIGGSAVRVPDGQAPPPTGADQALGAGPTTE